MSPVRRVVTQTNSAGESEVASDGAPAVSDLPLEAGPELSVVWETAMPLSADAMGGDPEPLLPFPEPGSARFFRLVVHAGSEGGPDAFDIPMHRTDTLDVLFIAAGGIDLILDTGTVRLGSGDYVVLQGDLHAWRVNSPTEDCVITGAMLARAEADG